MAKTNWFWWLLLAGWMCAGSWWHMCHVKQLCLPVADSQITVKGQAVQEPTVTGDSLVGGVVVDLQKVAGDKSTEKPVAGKPEAIFEPVELHFQTGSDVYIPAPAAGDFVGRAKQFLANSGRTLSIYGHADNSGNAQANADLSLARAERVKKELVSAGISADRLVVKAMGQKAPQASNNTAEGRAQNRRVSIVAE